MSYGGINSAIINAEAIGGEVEGLQTGVWASSLVHGVEVDIDVFVDDITYWVSSQTDLVTVDVAPHVNVDIPHFVSSQIFDQNWSESTNIEATATYWNDSVAHDVSAFVAISSPYTGGGINFGEINEYAINGEHLEVQRDQAVDVDTWVSSEVYSAVADELDNICWVVDVVPAEPRTTYVPSRQDKRCC